MALFAEGEVWNNLAAVLLASATLLTVILNWVTTMVGHYLNAKRIDDKAADLKKDVRENTDYQKTILPAVEEKTGSAVRAAENAQVEAKKITETAAAKVGILIGKVLSDKAELAADKVATVALKVSESMASTVDKIATSIHGPDGTCLTGKVEEHGRSLEALGTRVGRVEADVGEVKKDTRQILELLQSAGK